MILLTSGSARFWLYCGLYETLVTGQRTGSTKRHKTGLLFLAQWSMQNQ